MGIMVVRGIIFGQQTAFLHIFASLTVQRYIKLIIVVVVWTQVYTELGTLLQQDDVKQHVALRTLKKFEECFIGQQLRTSSLPWNMFRTSSNAICP